MTPQEFISSFRDAFGEKPELPIAFRYTDAPMRPVEKIGGCFFKVFGEVREGLTVSLNAENIGCGGGKLYTGFTPMAPHITQFVSVREKYKQTPEMVERFVGSLDLRPAPKAWLEFLRVDLIDSWNGIEGVLFFAAPDVLSGLVSWATFDRDDAVSTPFGSGCSSVVAQAVRENREGGCHSFLGLFDPSVRPWVGANELSLTVPMSRWRVMLATMRDSSLFTHAWGKVKERING
jgi:hypothetical protein